MKKNLLLILLLVGFVSCSTYSYQSMANIDNNIKKINIGMTQEDVISILGNFYEIIDSKKESVILGYKSYDNGIYKLTFQNGELTEWHKEWFTRETSSYQPNATSSTSQPINATVTQDIFDNLQYTDSEGKTVTIKKDIFENTQIEDNRGNKISIKKDIFGDTQIEDNKGNRSSMRKDIFGNLSYINNGEEISIKRDIFGDLSFSGGGKNAKLKKDIFDTRTYSDSKGNKIEFNKEVWENFMKSNDNNDQIFFISLIKKYLYS